MRKRSIFVVSILAGLSACDPPSFERCLIENMRGQTKDMMTLIIFNYCKKLDPKGYDAWDKGQQG